MRPNKIGLTAHPGKPGVAELTKTLAQEFERIGIPVLIEANTAALAGMKSSSTIADLGREADLLVVLGGDGTILHLRTAGRQHQTRLRDQYRRAWFFDLLELERLRRGG